MLASPKINVQTKLILFKRAKFRCLHIDKNLTIDGDFEFFKKLFFSNRDKSGIKRVVGQNYS